MVIIVVAGGRRTSLVLIPFLYFFVFCVVSKSNLSKQSITLLQKLKSLDSKNQSNKTT